MNYLLPLLNLLPAVGPVVAAAPAFKQVFDEFVDLLDNDDDQETAKAAYADLIADNAEGFARLDAKLEAAKAR